MKTTIIGGGIAGLFGAVKLARAGHQVTLFEKGELGGRARSPSLGDRAVNLGAHALYRAGPAAAELKALGVKWKGLPPSSTGGFVVDGDELLPLGLTAMSLSASPLLQGGRMGFFRALVEIERAKASDDQLTVSQWLNQCSLPRRPKALLQALLRIASYIEAPEHASAGPVLRNFKMAINANVSYLEGGWATLIEPLKAMAIEAGVELRQARVESVLPDATVVLASGERLTADAVITTLPLRDSVRLTQSPELKRLEQTAVESRAACLDVVLDRLPRPDHRVAFGLDRPTYFSVHFENERSVQIHAMRYLGPNDDGAGPREEMEALCDRMQPGWRQHVKDLRFMPHLTVMSRVPLPGEQVTPVSVSGRVIAAGDWCGPGLLLDRTIASVGIACERLLESAKLAA